MVQATSPTSVYRYYDKNNVLIYVGITSRGMARNSEHNTSKDWWPHVHRQEVDHLVTRAEAERHEKALIRSFRPPFNKQHNPEAREMRAAYDSFQAACMDGQTGSQVVTQHGGRLPLALLSQGSGTVMWRTLLADSAAALELHLVGQPKVVAASGLHFGHIRQLQLQGPLAIITAAVRTGLEVSTARLRVKQMPGKPLRLTLGSVICDLDV